MTDRQMTTDPAVFFADGCGRCDRFATDACRARVWATGIARLREICLAAGLTETAKWGHPCYMHAGRNIALIGAFAGDFRLNFMNAALLSDPENLLERQGPNARDAGTLKFTDTDGPAAIATTIAAYLAEAKALAASGARPERRPTEVTMPDELTEALDADPPYADAFAALTPGRQRSWCLHVGGAKQAATRARRVVAMRDRVLAGKGWNER